MFVALFNN